jgi:hypothetical protein
MNKRNPTPTASSYWRARFVEIGRQAEAELPRGARPSGLRPRSRMAGFAALRLGRRPAALPRLA